MYTRKFFESVIAYCYIALAYLIFVMVIFIRDLIGVLLAFGIRHLIGLLNGSITGLSNPSPIGVDLMYNKAKFMSLFIFMHFIIVYLMNFMHSSTCPLPRWQYDDSTACSMFNVAQLKKISEIKLLLV